jgi:hypothetical protein
VSGNPVSFAGDPTMTNKSRKFGLLYTTDPNHPELTALAKAVKQDVEACGVSFGDDVATFPYAGYVVDASYTPEYAASNMARFKQDGVTTILWPAGFETNQSKAASSIQYLPEWIQGGDYLMEGTSSSASQNQAEWAHARSVTPLLPVPVGPVHRNPNCVQAIRSVDPVVDPKDVNWACNLYEGIRQMFVGIQVAGPKLTPTSMDQGFHAIPAHESTDAFSPACYYLAADYNCVKDAVAQWWDGSAPYANNQGSGCWRMFDSGKRHTSGRWPPGQVPNTSPNDPCDIYDVGIFAHG